MATVDDILNNKPQGDGGGYTVTESQLNAMEANDAARKQAEAVKKEQMAKGTGGKAPGTVTGPASIKFKPEEVQKPKRPSIKERMDQWKLENPAPVRKEVPEPEYKSTYNYQDILDQYKKVEQVPEKEAKDQKWNQSIGAIGDALAALVNAAGTSNGANNMELDPANGLAENIRRRYEDTREKQKGDREKYLGLMLKAAQLEDSDNMKKYSLYQQALNNADRDYNSKLNAWNRAYDQQAKGYRDEDKAEDAAEAKKAAAEQKKADAEALAAYREEQLKIAKGKAAETSRHNHAMENRPSGGSKGGSGTQKVQEFGDYRSDRVLTASELKGVKEEMAAAGCFDDLSYLDKKNKSAEELITYGSSKKKGATILTKHGFKKYN